MCWSEGVWLASWYEKGVAVTLQNGRCVRNPERALALQGVCESGAWVVVAGLRPVCRKEVKARVRGGPERHVGMKHRLGCIQLREELPRGRGQVHCWRGASVERRRAWHSRRRCCCSHLVISAVVVYLQRRRHPSPPLLSRSGGQHRWNAMVNCNHGDSISSRFGRTCLSSEAAAPFWVRKPWTSVKVRSPSSPPGRAEFERAIGRVEFSACAGSRTTVYEALP
eukprot:COSAG01_NODE_7002_length_3397_cov_5.500910_1_plen_224_part_00